VSLYGPCSTLGALNCLGHAQKVQLLCDGAQWVANGACSGIQLCDTSPGANQGLCADPIAACLAQQPGAQVCSGTNQIVCGPDLVTISASVPCANGCANGACCAGTTKVCSSTCVDVAIDNANCGFCGHVCPAGSTCQSSICVCGGGKTLCGNTCIDTSIDPQHCGSCATTCSANHVVSATCLGGVCNGTCVASYGDCNGDKAKDGCELYLPTSTDPNNCGACGNVCGGGQNCVSGGCVCPAGQSTCPNADGGVHCADLSTNANDCGTCNNPCSGTNCYAGVCKAGPCDGLCTAPIQLASATNNVVVNTTAAMCWAFPAPKLPQKLYGDCGNVTARTISVNGQDVTSQCGAWPQISPTPTGYCVVLSAGTPSYPWWGTWSY
jgi:hypothetical protein